MKMLKYVIIFVLILLCVCAVGCQKKKIVTYEQINAQEAKTIMDESTGYVVLDVRTPEEFEQGHIVGAINIDHEEITEKAESVLLNKEQLILVYCRSGRRSKIASDALVKLGYTNVKEFGGINDWPYETEK